MTEKERAKCQQKGISTITQLSYGYRPRRRRRIKSTAVLASPRVKHDHKLKALAIKKGHTHVVGSPSLSIEGTPVFMDVEGLPDRDLYYLIGLRYEERGLPVQRSFWANGPEGECDIWQECIRALRQIDNPRIIHYGAYESRFLKSMKQRWKSPGEYTEFIDRLVSESLNLLAVMYGTIYFPTYSNGLKDIARSLGFEWSWQQASGSAAIVLRRCWELTGDEELRRKLIAYNIDDCRAATAVFEAITQICGNGRADSTVKLETVNVAALEVPFQRTFGKFPSVLPEFEKINKAAYWDYQRSKVYVRTDKTIRRSVEKELKPARKISVERQFTVDDKPAYCPTCVHQKCG
jgi:predicted RecB family nuclease